MSFLLPWLMLAVQADAPTEGRYPGAAPVFECDFGTTWDKNLDGWPDGWTRRRGPAFPAYLKVQIVPNGTPSGKACLRTDLDGSGVRVYSPPIPVAYLYSYVLEGWVKTEGLVHDRACFSLTLLDGKQQPLETFYSEKVGDSEGWTKVRLGPVVPRYGGAQSGVVGLHLEPGESADLTGSAWFGDLWLGRLPRLSLRANSRHQVFADPGQISVTCDASGFDRRDAGVTFQLVDVTGRELARHEAPLGAAAVAVGGGSSPGAAQGLSVWKGSAQWKPPVSGPGFYRLRATLEGLGGARHYRELTLAVIAPQAVPSGGEFGWSLPRGDKPLAYSDLADLVSQAGIGWVKYPLWLDEQTDEAEVERILLFGDRLAAQGIELVGLLSDPPPSVRRRLGPSGTSCAAEVFTAPPEVWYPSLELVMTRLATQVRWWQLGSDEDASFVGYPKLAEKISQVKGELDRVGHDVSLGIGWNWLYQAPRAADGKPACRFLVWSSAPPLTPRELAVYLPAARQPQQQQCWVVLEPLAAERYSLDTRAADLVQRMMAAKIHGADAIFIPDPFSTQHGLMNDDGTPGELLLPWRTSALMLSGAKYLGSLELPGGSENRVFSRNGEAVMVLWNRRPQEEALYLGESVREVDLWGRSRVPEADDSGQILQAGPLPTIVTGVDEAITRWRQDFRLAQDRIPSVCGRPLENALSVKNSFGRGVSGELRLVAPEQWKIEPAQVPFKLAEGEELRQNFTVTLPYDASCGRQMLRIDCTVQSDRPCRFSVYRRIEVGLGDVSIDLLTRLNAQGELEVEQHFVNAAPTPVSFRCELFAPDRRRMKSEVFGQGLGRDVKVYRLPNGRELLGKTLWLRAEELNGGRVLNYRFVAEVRG